MRLLGAGLIVILVGLTGCGDESAKVAETVPSYRDVVAYCDAVQTVDAPDQRWTGAAIPHQVLGAADTKYSARVVEANNVLWRCMNGDVVWCLSWVTNFCPKGDLSTKPSQAILTYCSSSRHLNDDSIGRSDAGLGTIWTWACRNGVPFIRGQFAPVDARGFHAWIWHVLTPDGSDRFVPTVAATP